MEKNGLASRIRAFRKLKGYTQIELAESLGVSVSIIGSIERGTRPVNSRTLQNIADVLGVEITELQPTGMIRKEEM